MTHIKNSISLSSFFELNHVNVFAVFAVLVLFMGSASFVDAASAGSPSSQIESGVAPKDIICNENKVLILRDNGSIACVTERIADRMNWEVTDTEFAPTQKSDTARLNYHTPSVSSTIPGAPHGVVTLDKIPSLNESFILSYKFIQPLENYAFFGTITITVDDGFLIQSNSFTELESKEDRCGKTTKSFLVDTDVFLDYANPISGQITMTAVKEGLQVIALGFHGTDDGGAVMGDYATVQLITDVIGSCQVGVNCPELSPTKFGCTETDVDCLFTQIPDFCHLRLVSGGPSIPNNSTNSTSNTSVNSTNSTSNTSVNSTNSTSNTSVNSTNSTSNLDDGLVLSSDIKNSVVSTDRIFVKSSNKQHHSHTLHIDPIYTADFPATVNVGETFVVDYTYSWMEPDEDTGELELIIDDENNIFYQENDYAFQILLPDEFSVVTPNIDSINLMADTYVDHVLRLYFISVPYDFTPSNTGTIEFRLDKEMMYDEDYFRLLDRTNSGLFIMKQNNGVKFVSEQDMGRMFNLSWDPDGHRYNSFPDHYEDYVPQPKPEPRASNTSQEPAYIPKSAWDVFTKFLRAIQINPNPQNMTQWMLNQNFSQQFINDYFEEYPEFRVQSVR